MISRKVFFVLLPAFLVCFTVSCKKEGTPALSEFNVYNESLCDQIFEYAQCHSLSITSNKNGRVLCITSTLPTNLTTPLTGFDSREMDPQHTFISIFDSDGRKVSSFNIQPFEITGYKFRIHSMAATKDNGFIVGSSLTTVSNNLSIPVLFKMNQSGDVVWTSRLDSIHDFYFTFPGIAEGPDSSFYAVVNTSDSNYILKCNRNGVFEKKILYDQSTYFSTWNVKILESKDGNLVSLGYGIDMLSHRSFVAVNKKTPAGNTLWTHFHFPDSLQFPVDMAEDANGNLWICGSRYTPSSKWDVYLVKLDAAGGLTKQAIFQLPFNEYSFHLSAMSDGCMIAGTESLNEYGLYSGNNGADPGYFLKLINSDTKGIILKIDNNLNLAWKKEIGNSYGSTGNYVIASGSAFLAMGNELRFGNPDLANIFFQKIDQNGK